MPKSGTIPIRLDPATANVSSLGSLVLLSVSFWLLARQQANYTGFQLIHVLFILLGLPVLVVLHEAVHALAGMHLKSVSQNTLSKCCESLAKSSQMVSELMPLGASSPADNLTLMPSGAVRRRPPRKGRASATFCEH